MKRNFTLIVILIFIISTINVFSQDQNGSIIPNLRGARTPSFINSLDAKYCNDVTNVDIVPNTWDAETTVMNWKVTFATHLNPDQPSWYTVTGTGKSTVLHFNPSAVPSMYYGVPIVFVYEQSNGIGPVGINGYDYTYISKVPDVFNFGSDTTLCPGQTVDLELSGSENNMRYYLQLDGTVVDSLDGSSAPLTFANISAPGKYTVIAKNINNFDCLKNMIGDADVSFFPPNTPTISGSADICIGSGLGQIYTTEPGMQNYAWTISAGGTIIAGLGTNEITVDWTVVGAQTITVNYENTNGCEALTPTSYPVVVHALPIPVIVGPATVCQNSNSLFSTAAGMNSYSWQITSTGTGGTIISGAGTNVINTSWADLGAQTISLSYVDSFGCVTPTPTLKNITVVARPVPTIAGPIVACEGTVGHIYTTEALQSTYTWTVSSGGTITAGAGTNQITVSWNTDGARTVSVNYRNAAGCVALVPTVLNVTVNPQPSPTIAGEDSICLGTDLNTLYTTEVGMSNYAWTVSAGGTINVGQGSDKVNVTWTTLGNKTVTATYSNGFGCFPPTPASFSVTVYPLPVPTIVAADTVCAGSTNVTYTTQNGKNNYVWDISPGGTITSGAGTFQIKATWNTFGDNWVKVNYENPTGCTAIVPVTKNVYVKPKPTPSLAGPNSFCLDTTSVKTYTTDAGQNTYNWIVSPDGDIMSGVGTNQITVKWKTHGTKTVSINYTNSFGCEAPTPTILSVVINPLPVVTITGLGVVCAGTTGVKYTTEPGMSSYNWTIVGGTITAGLNTNEVTVSWLTAGVGKSIRVNYSNSFGCTATTAANLDVTVKAAPTPTVGGATVVCQGSTNVVYTTQGGFSNYSWTVSAGGTIVGAATTNSIMVNWNTAGPQTVRANYENSDGCSAATPAVRNVNVIAKPIPTITGLINPCQGTVVYTTETAMNSYVWTVSSPGGSVQSGAGTNEIVVKWDSIGAQNVSVTYVNGTCAAAAPTVKNIVVNPAAKPTITGGNLVCADNSNVNYSTEPGMGSYTWGVSAGGTIISGQGTDQISVQWSSGGPKLVTVNYANSFGCFALTPSLYNVTVKTLPVPTITGSTIVCVNDAGVVYTTDPGMSNYDWDISAGGIITSGDGTNQITVTWNTAGSNTVSVNYQNTDLCTGANPTVMNVDVVAIPVPTITATNGGCLNSSTTYTTEAGMNNYVWNVTPDGTITSGLGTNTINVTWNNLGSQTVDVTYELPTGCAPVAPTILNLTVEANPIVSLTADKTTICQNDLVQFEATNALAHYDYFINGISIDNGANPIYSTTTLNNADHIYVQATSLHGCSSISTPDIIMSVASLPVAGLTANPGTTIIQAMPVIFTASGVGDYEFLLNGNIVQNYSVVNTYSNSALNDGDVITVNVKNANGCISSATLTMQVIAGILPLNVSVNPSGYCQGDPNGITVFMNNPQAGLIYELIRVLDGQNLGQGTLAGSVLSWTNIKNTSSGSQEYKVEAYHPLFPATRVEMTNRINIVENLSPVAFNITPNGIVNDCNGGLGYEIKLSDSQIGVEYDLYIDGNPSGITKSGTDNELSFGTFNTDGEYTIIASYPSGMCSTQMNGSFEMNISSAKTIFNLSSNPANGHFCESAVGVELLLSGSTIGENYILVRDAVTPVDTIIGDGNPINFGYYNIEGVYSVRISDAGCFVSMNGSVNVIKDLLPSLYVVTASNNGNYCAGGVGVSISLSNQQAGIEYQLLYNGNPIGAPIVGTLPGAILDFPGLHTNAGVYAVQQSIPGMTCQSTTTRNALVKVIPYPNDLPLEGDTAFCNSGSGVIYLDNSETDVLYNLYLDGLNTGVSLNGNGGRIFFTVNQEGVYKIAAEKMVGGITCPLFLTDSVDFKKSASPAIKNYTWVNGSSCSDGTVITVLQSEIGVTYELYNRASGLAVSGYSILGDGFNVSFPGIVDGNGDYYIVASNATCSVELTNFGDIHVAIPGVPIKMEVIQPPTMCAGTDVYLGLKNTQLSIVYDLYLVGGGAMGADLKVQTIVGSGAPKNYLSKITTPGTYYVIGTDYSTVPACQLEMINRVTVAFNSLPIVYNMVGSGIYCNGMSGAIMGLDDTEIGVEYFLKDNLGNKVDSIIGSGNSISFAPQVAQVNYSVSAVSPAGCTSNMNKTVTVLLKSTPNVYTVTINNINYCGAAIGADMLISGTQKDVTYIITEVHTNTVTKVLATLDNPMQVLLAAVPDGDYLVEATWESDGCVTSLTSSPLHVEKAPVPVTPINITIDDILICAGDSTYVKVSNVEIGVYYDLVKNNVRQNKVINSAIDPVVWKVDGVAGDDDDYKVFGYFNGYTNCGQESSKVVNLKVKAPPTSFALSPTSVSNCLGDPGVTFSVSGSQAEIIYELYDASNVRVDNYTPALAHIGDPFSFSKLFNQGTYTLIASYISGRCASSPNPVAVITEDDSSFVCFPFEAISDTLYVGDSQNANSSYVSLPTNGGNDIISPLVDVNLSYNLITSWVDANGNTANTKGTVSFDPTNKDFFTYTKSSNFYGKDSVLYEMVNIDHPNRRDTAMIYILVGNKEIDGDRFILIPNAFSPNGDGKNDKFVITGYEDQESSVLKIFNRWGAIVYESTGQKYINDWEGMGNKGLTISIGKDLPVGTYFYVFNVTFNQNGSKIEKKYSGYIELRR